VGRRIARDCPRMDSPRCPKIAISPDNRLVVVGDETVAIYSMEGRQVNHSVEVGNRVRSMSLILS
jgi:hypothetical protein